MDDDKKTANGNGMQLESDSPQQKRLRLVLKASEIAKQLMMFNEEEQQTILSELAFILCIGEQPEEAKP